MDFDDIDKKVSRSGSELVELREALRLLKGRVDQQALLIHALREALLDQGVLDKEELQARLQYAKELKEDDKTCRTCGKPLGAKHAKCMYCGQPRSSEVL